MGFKAKLEVIKDEIFCKMEHRVTDTIYRFRTHMWHMLLLCKEKRT